MEKYRFFVLLGALAALLVGPPLAREFSPLASPMISRVIVTGLFVAMLLSAVLAVGGTRWKNKIAVLLAVPVVLFQLVSTVFPGAVLEVSTHLLDIIFVGYVVLVIIRYLFATDRVTANTICAAISVYLLLGVLFALVFSTVEILRPSSFTALVEDDSSIIQFGAEHSADALYFSFVTLTTLGFGDITPTSAAARMLVTLEAVIGQFFLTVLIARLVGLHITHASSNWKKDE